MNSIEPNRVTDLEHLIPTMTSTLNFGSRSYSSSCSCLGVESDYCGKMCETAFQQGVRRAASWVTTRRKHHLPSLQVVLFKHKNVRNASNV